MKKSQQVSESFTLAVILTLSGGLMDAYSYICRGHVFANAQTGNILLLGVNLSTGNLSAALHYLFPVLAFASGIAAAEIVKYSFRSNQAFHWRQITLLTEAVILIAVAFIPQSANLLANCLISFTCGAQVESFRKVNGSGIATTMCIGNLRAATQSICEFCFYKNKTAGENGLLYFSIIGTFVIGAVIGNFCVEALDELAILASSLLLLTGFGYMLSKKEI